LVSIATWTPGYLQFRHYRHKFLAGRARSDPKPFQANMQVAIWVQLIEILVLEVPLAGGSFSTTIGAHDGHQYRCHLSVDCFAQAYDSGSRGPRIIHEAAQFTADTTAFAGNFFAGLLGKLHYESNELKWPKHAIVVLMVHDYVVIRRQ